MPNQPNDRYQQGTERLWQAPEAVSLFPAQPPYRGTRPGRGPDAAWSWRELNKLPAGVSTRRGLGTH